MSATLTWPAVLTSLIDGRDLTIAEATCAAFELQCEFEFARNYPPTINHEAETTFVRPAQAGEGSCILAA